MNSAKGAEDMKNKLGENIKSLRKSRKLTQEQLAEAMGVTSGAVYKWEAQLSAPDIDIIILLAEYFEVSVDVLLGYEIQSSKLSAMLDRIQGYYTAGDIIAAREEAEKALQKYPNNFKVVYLCAQLHFVSAEKDSYRRAMELFNRSLELIDQNTDEDICEATICRWLAQLHAAVDEYDEAIELLKKHNFDGHNEATIGDVLARGCKKPDEALPHLSNALLKFTETLLFTCIGYANAYFQKKDYSKGRDILLWFAEAADGLRATDGITYYDKIRAVFYAGSAGFSAEEGNLADARKYLKKAHDIALRFDAKPTYSMENQKFYHGDDDARAHDDLGNTAVEAIVNLIDKEEVCRKLLPIWEEIRNGEN